MRQPKLKLGCTLPVINILSVWGTAFYFIIKTFF